VAEGLRYATDLRGDDRKPASKAEERPAIPADLMAIALSEDAGSHEATKMAQESVVDAIYDAYRRTKDWNKVRAAMGVGELA